MQCGYRPTILLRLYNSATRRRHRHSSTPSLPGSALPADFLWFPRFFDLAEQHALLSAALRKLDAAEPRASRRQRRNYLASHPRVQTRDTGDPRDVFFPDDIYHFEEVRLPPLSRLQELIDLDPHLRRQGHYDGVIRQFREMRVSTWDDESDPVVHSALGRLETLYPYPGSNTQTHLLHLASNGEIHPHVDNIGASGSWILGVSLGSERVLRMESVEDDVNGVPKYTFDLSLPSGSVYIQR
jgi:alkylated DNA repair protein alkB homolog 7